MTTTPDSTNWNPSNNKNIHVPRLNTEMLSLKFTWKRPLSEIIKKTVSDKKLSGELYSSAKNTNVKKEVPPQYKLELNM